MPSQIARILIRIRRWSPAPFIYILLQFLLFGCSLYKCQEVFFNIKNDWTSIFVWVAFTMTILFYFIVHCSDPGYIPLDLDMITEQMSKVRLNNATEKMQSKQDNTVGQSQYSMKNSKEGGVITISTPRLQENMEKMEEIGNKVKKRHERAVEKYKELSNKYFINNTENKSSEKPSQDYEAQIDMSPPISPNARQGPEQNDEGDENEVRCEATINEEEGADIAIDLQQINDSLRGSDKQDFTINPGSKEQYQAHSPLNSPKTRAHERILDQLNDIQQNSPTTNQEEEEEQQNSENKQYQQQQQQESDPCCQTASSPPAPGKQTANNYLTRSFRKKSSAISLVTQSTQQNNQTTVSNTITSCDERKANAESNTFTQQIQTVEGNTAVRAVADASQQSRSKAYSGSKFQRTFELQNMMNGVVTEDFQVISPKNNENSLADNIPMAAPRSKEAQSEDSNRSPSNAYSSPNAKNSKESATNAAPSSTKNSADEELFVERRLCIQCNVVQQLRTKHCHDCNRCVATYDHHCPWVGTCIGERNRCPFYWFMLFQIMQMSIAMFKVIKYLVQYTGQQFWADHYLTVAVLTVQSLFFLMVLILLIYHTFLMFSNLTTWENVSWHKITYLKDWPEDLGSPFSEGCWRNFKRYCKCRFGSVQLYNWRIPAIKASNSQGLQNQSQNEQQ